MSHEPVFVHAILTTYFWPLVALALLLIIGLALFSRALGGAGRAVADSRSTAGGNDSGGIPAGVEAGGSCGDGGSCDSGD